MDRMRLVTGHQHDVRMHFKRLGLYVGWIARHDPGERVVLKFWRNVVLHCFTSTSTL